MSVLGWIIVVSLLGGVLSVAAAGFFALTASARLVPAFVSYAIGALLGAVFVEILPHALETGAPASALMATVLGGILGFFILEKLVIWHHCHGDTCEVHASHAHHDHDNGRSGLMIMVGDTFHNFVDGVLIAAAFLTDVQLGFVTALAIIAHEIPQEVGNFVILLHSGYGRKKALVVNLLSSLAMLVGGVLGYVALSEASSGVPYLLAIAAASMIYVAVADLIPGLHKRPELPATVQQVLLIGLGIGTVLLARLLFGE